MISLRNVTKAYPNGVAALRDVDLEMSKGEFVFLVGPSGAGKSTLLRLLFREEVPTSGVVLVNGHDVGHMRRKQIPYLRRQVGVVFQDFRLLPQRTVADNIAFALRVTEVHPKEIKRRVAQVLELVGLMDRIAALPGQLSGGEQQRVAIARALVIKPAIVLADEPTGNLDRANGRAVMDLLADLNERLAVTILLVTHDPVFAAMAKRVLRLVDGALEQAMAFDDNDAALPASERGLAG